MKLTPEQRKEIVANLVTNCGCGHVSADDLPWKGETEASLNAKDDEKLYTMEQCRKAMAKTENVSKALAFEDPLGNKHRYNPTTNLWETMPKSTPTPTPIPPTVNAGAVPVVIPPTGPKPMSELIKQASPEDQQAWAAVMEVHNQAKGALIGQLVANIAAGPIRDQAIQMYSGMQLGHLQVIAASMPKVDPTPAPTPTFNFLGAQGAPPPAEPVINEAPLPSPTWKPKAKAS